MLLASRNEMIKEKVFQIVEKAGSGANRRQSSFFMEHEYSIDAAKGPGPVRPNPRPFRMISYDDMMLAD